MSAVRLQLGCFKCHDDLSMGVRRDDAGLPRSLICWLVARAVQQRGDVEQLPRRRSCYQNCYLNAASSAR